MHPMWQDPGTWIAIGISVLFLVAGWAMHRIFVRILKNGAPPPAPFQDPLQDRPHE
ncbi:MAG: hypothetical protein PHW78_06180 [Macromonas bipunctata]|nr:hypothetical protein [Macromonas bipunctata]